MSKTRLKYHLKHIFNIKNIIAKYENKNTTKQNSE